MLMMESLNASKPLTAFRDKGLVKKVAEYLRERCEGLKARIMHVCGTHEQVISKYGLRSLLPDGIEVIAGPGCPVCVVPSREIDEAVKIAISDKRVVLATFGDMFRVPGTSMSLADAKAAGADVRIVYSIHDALKLALNNPDREVVFFAIGFETTAPITAAEILRFPPDNFSILTSHRLIPPVMELLLGLGETYFDGFICPGHVATIIGVKPFKLFADVYRMPTVIAGFEPLDVMIAIKIIIDQLRSGTPRVENEYTRSVTYEGNVKAQKLVDTVFNVESGHWRGIGRVPFSTLRLRDELRRYDARVKFSVEVKGSRDLHPGCSCHLIMLGKLIPPDCPLFAKLCTPSSPRGPCMVSSEGTCNIWYKYRGEPIP